MKRMKDVIKPVVEIGDIDKRLGEEIDGVFGYEVIEKGDNDVVLKINTMSFNQSKRIV